MLSAPVPLTAEHDISSFECGVPALNDWLKQRALKNEGRFSRTFVTCDGDRTAGYYCISAGTVERAAAPGNVRRNAPAQVPVSIIGRLAVDWNYGGRGLGADLLADALRRIANAAETIGIAAVLVHAKDDKARAFYLTCAEFVEYPADSRILFLPIQAILST